MKGFIKGTSTDQIKTIEKVCVDGIYYYETEDGKRYEIEDIVVTDNDGKFLVVNSTNVPINISHLQGTSRERLAEFLERIKNETVLTPPTEKFDIITTYTNPDDCILYQQLKKFDIPCINSYNDDKEPSEWSMPDKVGYILSALEKSKEEIVLICDGYDVLVNSFENIVHKFKKTGLRMFFNGTKNNFPATHVDRIPYRDWRGEYRYFNAGCAIGYREDFIKFYRECQDLILNPSFMNPWESEQFVLRTIFSQYSEVVDTDQAYMDFDWRCNIFQTYVNAINAKVYDNIFAIV